MEVNEIKLAVLIVRGDNGTVLTIASTQTTQLTSSETLGVSCSTSSWGRSSGIISDYLHCQTRQTMISDLIDQHVHTFFQKYV